MKQQAYDYDLNANRAQDERGAHEFNARDQLVLWNPDAAGKPDVAYELNGSGGIVRQTRGDEVTTYVYGPGDERLGHADVTVGGVPTGTTNYSYDKGFGDVTEYRLEGASEPDPSPRPSSTTTRSGARRTRRAGPRTRRSAMTGSTVVTRARSAPGSSKCRTSV